MARGLCGFSGCERPFVAKGLCGQHWRQQRKGRLLTPIRMPVDLATRFWVKVNKDGPVVRQELGQCWVWTAAKDRHGYGSILMSEPKRGPKLAHRVAWELVHGPLGENEQVLHRCDNPPCVRDEHLFKGDPAINAADRHAKGRDAMEGRNPRYKLTSLIVADIRRRHEEGPTALAREFGVHVGTVADVLSGRSWKDASRG